jgi:hypothetical protein
LQVWVFVLSIHQSSHHFPTTILRRWRRDWSKERRTKETRTRSRLGRHLESNCSFSFTHLRRL